MTLLLQWNGFKMEQEKNWTENPEQEFECDKCGKTWKQKDSITCPKCAK